MSAPDSHLRVVARVRAVRERDSRIGLVEALAEERAAQERATELRERLDAVPALEAGDLASFSARQYTVAAMSAELAAARAGTDSSRLVALAARDRWQTDRSRLAAVESLIERRDAARALERQRREDRELDAVAERQWLRRSLEDVTP